MPAHTLDQIGRRLRVRDLQVFLAAVECGSMAKAAAQLGVTQPAVSEIIAGLESTFGARLFDRSPQGIETTLYGRALLDRALTVLDELKQVAKDIAFLADPTVGELRIGCPDSIAGGFLPTVIEKFASAYPGIALHIDLLTTPALDLPPLRARKLDLALTRLPRSDEPPDSDLNVEILFDDEAVVAASTRSRWTRQRKIRLADLAEAQWILTPAGSLAPELIAEAFELIQLKAPKVIVTSFSVHMRTHLLANSEYVAAMPRSVLQANAKIFGLKMLPVKLPARRFPVALVTLQNRTLSPVAELFIKHLKKQIGSATRSS
ncbi:MAG: LysR family transcriptional regulator [Xanthobacteraceae bacterium]